ncbi:MAG: hypothetical protein ACKO9H_01045, partial [Planctomycetota bacterium]
MASLTMALARIRPAGSRSVHNSGGDATESGTIAEANKVERRAEEKLLAIERYLQLTPEQIAGYRANQRS